MLFKITKLMAWAVGRKDFKTVKTSHLLLLTDEV